LFRRSSYSSWINNNYASKKDNKSTTREFGAVCGMPGVRTPNKQIRLYSALLIGNHIFYPTGLSLSVLRRAGINS